MSHTPGPWTVEMTQTEDGEPFGYVLADEGIVTMVTLRPEQVEANAHLIAAAPELFYALKSFVEITEGSGAIKMAAIRAIAKAEGRQ